MRASLLTIAGLRAWLSQIYYAYVNTSNLVDGAVTNAKMADIATKTMKARVTSGTGPPETLTIAQFLETSGHGSAVFCTDSTEAVTWIHMQTGRQVLTVKAAGTDPIAVRYGISGSFPTTPQEGQWCWRDDLDDSFVYSATASGWVSHTVYAFEFSAPSDVSTSIYLGYGPATQAAGELFTANFGPMYPFDVVVVGIAVAMAASGSCGIQVFDDGSGVTGATLSLSSQQKKSSWFSTYSSVIAADSIIGVQRTSGTVEGPFTGTVWLRRYAT